MYSTCLFCGAALGTNEAIETFPVGGCVAFDADRGRLWAVCRRCGRWNLAPLEERWEAVEEADRLFTDTRERVHSQNIGLARLPDGTRLVRVGQALPGELAAWRYGSQLISRRRRNIAITAAGVTAVGAVIAGFPLIASAGIPVSLLNVGVQVNAIVRVKRQQQRVVHRLPASESPTGSSITIRRWHLHSATLAQDEYGELGLDVAVPDVLQGAGMDGSVRLRGVAARRTVARSMVDYNSRGASRDDVQQALRAIEEAGGADTFTARTAAGGAAIVKPTRHTYRPQPAWSLRQLLGTFRGEVLPVVRYRSPFVDESRPRLSRVDALALEMALQDESERRALEGELAALEAAWREAEEIARIADALPGDPLVTQQHE